MKKLSEKEFGFTPGEMALVRMDSLDLPICLQG